MDVEQLRTFVQVVERASFAAVARHLNVAPSVVTRAVASLETELGVRLLQRSTRSLALTDAGVAYFERVRHILEELDSAADDAKASAAQVRGTVRITASVAYGQTVLVPLVARLHGLYPALEVDLLLTDIVVDLVGERVDIALRLGVPGDSSLIGTPIGPSRYRVCASPEYLTRCGKPEVPADLSQHECLRFPFPGFPSEWKFKDSLGRVEAVEVHGWLTASTALTLHRAALHGLGTVLLADWLVRPDIDSGRLLDLFPNHEVSATDFDGSIWLLYASRSHVPLRVRVVMDFLRRHLAVQ